jgi:hypothetical protein
MDEFSDNRIEIGDIVMAKHKIGIRFSVRGFSHDGKVAYLYRLSEFGEVAERNWSAGIDKLRVVQKVGGN